MKAQNPEEDLEDFDFVFFFDDGVGVSSSSWVLFFRVFFATIKHNKAQTKVEAQTKQTKAAKMYYQQIKTNYWLLVTGY
jgi:hypothetical protein